MRNLAILLFAAGFALPALAAKHITVDQLEKVLTAARGKPDAKVARQLSDLELTERVSAGSLSRWEASLPGPGSRRSLLLLADKSAFLDPPATEIPAAAAPDLAAQRQIIALAVTYAAKTISKLPDFFATRDTIRFEDTPPRQSVTGSVAGTFAPYQPLHPVAKSAETVLYRDGKEIVNPEAANGRRSEAPSPGLTAWGEFGPVLTTVLVDAAYGKIGWSHWEQGGAGPRAVFSYAIPKAKSHYEVNYCCVQRDNEIRAFQQLSGYHGEIAIDPANGAILRLIVEADLAKADPIVKADMMVEYGPVEIGGATYICPVKSVSISLAQEQDTLAAHLQGYTATMNQNTMVDRNTMVDPKSGDIPRPLQTLLDDVVFEQYHLFRADARILTGDGADTGGKHPM
jgi:hypothetical protein